MASVKTDINEKMEEKEEKDSECRSLKVNFQIYHDDAASASERGKNVGRKS